MNNSNSAKGSFDILHHNDNIIDFYVLDCLNNCNWYASGVYGHSNHRKNFFTRELINNIHN